MSGIYRNVTKKLPGVIALRDMTLQIKQGEIRGLIGENGAGKSTIIKTLTGAHMLDEGKIWVSGERGKFQNPSHARESI